MRILLFVVVALFASAAAAKNCKKGCACGDACIPCSHVCHVGTSTASAPQTWTPPPPPPPPSTSTGVTRRESIPPPRLHEDPAPQPRPIEAPPPPPATAVDYTRTDGSGETMFYALLGGMALVVVVACVAYFKTNRRT